MKRKLFMVAIAAVSMCVMVSCGKKDNKDNKANKEKDDTEQVAENDEEEDDADDTVEASVTKLLDSAYEDLSVIYGPRDEDDCEPNLDMFGMYCTEGFNQLVTDIRKVDYNQELEEDRFFQGSDLAMWSPWEEAPLSVDDVNVELNGEDMAYATYTLHHGDEWIMMGIELELENGEWRIKDFTKTGDVEASMEALMISYLRANER